jgi:hypothetical protein
MCWCTKEGSGGGGTERSFRVLHWAGRKEKPENWVKWLILWIVVILVFDTVVEYPYTQSNLYSTSTTERVERTKGIYIVPILIEPMTGDRIELSLKPSRSLPLSSVAPLSAFQSSVLFPTAS